MTRTHTNRIRSAAAALALAGGLGAAQAQTFQRFSGTGEDEIPYDIEETLDGGYVTAGMRTGKFGTAAAADPSDFLVTKYDKDGVPMWATQFGASRADVAYSVHPTLDGGYIVAGMTESTGPVLGLALVRLDPFGTVLWARAYPGDVFAELFNPAPDGTPPQVAVRESRETGEFMVTTNVRNAVGGQLGVYLRTDSMGFPLVHATYSLPMFGPLTQMDFADIKELPDLSMVITGFVDINGVDSPFGLPQDFDVLGMRISPAGIPIWAMAYGQPNIFAREAGYGIDVDPNGGRAVIGAGADFVTGTFGTQHIWIDAPTGALVLANQFEGATPAYSATRFDGHLNVVTAGQDYFLGVPMHGKAFGVSFDFAGGFRWMWAYGPPSPATDRATTVAPISLGECGYIFAGPKDYALGLGRYDNHLIKTNDAGSSGCCEDAWQVPVQYPALRQVPLQFDVQYTDEWINWGEQVDVAMDDVVRCYSPKCKPCPIDLNGDGVFNLDDINLFVTLYLAGDARVDFRCDGVINLDDLNTFVALVGLGC